MSDRPHVGQSVIWLEQRKWGGKQNQPAKYLHGVGKLSARIELDDKTGRRRYGCPVYGGRNGYALKE